MVATDIIITSHVTPGNAERGDDRALIPLILMRQKEALTDVIEVSSVACDFLQWRRALAGSVPLLDETLALLFKRDVKRLKQRGRRAMEAVPESQAESKFVAFAQIQLSSERDVPIGSERELPIHLEVVHEIGPAVAATDISTRALKKRGRSSERQPRSPFMRSKNLSAGNTFDQAIIAPAANLEMRREQGIDFQPR